MSTVIIFKMLNIIECNDLFIFIADGAMHLIYSHRYNTNSAEDSSDMN